MIIPNDRCGFKLEPKLVIERSSVDRDTANRFIGFNPDRWYSTFNVSCCWREVWNDTGRCIWHAEVDDKPIEDLIVARSSEPDPTALDGAFLQNLELDDRLSFQDCRLVSADLSDTGLVGADLWGADLRGTALVGADLTDAVLGGASLWSADLLGADLTDALLERADFTGAVLEGADLLGASLLGADLTAANLFKANLSEADLRGAVLKRADLRWANLSEKNLWEADLSEANLREANLSEAVLWKADLSKANLFEVDLSDTDLRNADLRGANFQGTTLANVRMNQKSLVGKSDTEYLVGELDEQFLVGKVGAPPPSDEESFIGQLDEESVDSLVYDSLARSYHSLGEAAKENGLVGKARRLRLWERKARQREARTNGDWRAWIGLLLSEWMMGYGISISRIFGAIVVIIFASAGAYLVTGVPGGEGPIQALDYSVTTFTGIGSNGGPPTAHPARSIVILESFAGILFSVLLGYVLGTRESP